MWIETRGAVRGDWYAMKIMIKSRIKIKNGAGGGGAVLRERNPNRALNLNPTLNPPLSRSSLA